MKCLGLSLAAVALLWICEGSLPAGYAQNPDTTQPTFFVATNGNDGWSGTLDAPNTSKSDGPFASVARAVAATRAVESRKTGAQRTPATIFVRGGLHCLKEPLVLTPEDSSLSILAFRGERPVFSGGRLIQGWKEVSVDGKRLWAAPLPAVREGEWYFRELWVDGRRAIRARAPNKGYFSIAEVPDKVPSWNEGQSRFRFQEGDLKNWPSATNAEVVAMTRWVESRLPIIGIDDRDRMVKFGKRSVFELSAGDLYYVEGAFECLDEPGEWYLDRAAGTLFYWPRAGQHLDRIQAIAPVLTQVLRLEGQPDTERFIQGVVFRGMTFGNTEWYFPEGFSSGKNRPAIHPAPKPEVGGFGQAAIGVPGAIWGEGVHECTFENCTFSNLGNYALELARGCMHNRIEGCRFSDLGAGGVKLGETSIRHRPAEQSGSNEVSECRIQDGGKMFHSAIGIWIGQSANNRLEHNLISDFYYTGISIGWTWGYGPALATNNVVDFNHVHHIGVKSGGDGPILSDMGGIYTLGKQPGTVIRNNLWHDIAGIRYGGWGIYFDEGSSGIVAESNVVYRTTHGGFHQHYGETNIVRNNIFAFARDHQIQRSRPEPHVSFSFETNIVYFDSGVLLGGTWANDHYVMDWNVYFDARPGATEASFPLGPCNWQQWHERGHDEHSIIADPLFAAPRESDFHLRDGSPALKIGFHPIDLSTGRAAQRYARMSLACFPNQPNHYREPVGHARAQGPCWRGVVLRTLPGLHDEAQKGNWIHPSRLRGAVRPKEGPSQLLHRPYRAAHR